MKRFYQLSLACLMALCCLFSLAACGGSDDKEDPIVSTPIVQRSCSLAEGAEVISYDVTQITLSYNEKVVPVPGKITLNGNSVEARNGSTKLDVVIPVTLQESTSYTLDVPAGAIVKEADSNVSAPAFRLTFRTVEVSHGPDSNLAIEMTKKLGFGWNLGNHFDSYDGNNAKDNYRITWSKDCPYWDGVNPKEDLYKNMAAAGVQTVRIPVTWGPYEDMTDGNYTIDANYMATVKQNVLWAKDAGLNVILNTHHDEYWQDAYTASRNATVNDETKERLTATWTQIAEAFKDEGDYLILEAFNELNHNWAGPTAGEYKIQNEWNQLVVDVIRATGGNNATRWIAVPSYQANIGYALKSDFQIPTDAANRIIVAVHCYDPYEFTLRDPLTEKWGHNAGNSWDEKNVVTTLNRLYDSFIAQNQPCYLGEFGCSIHTTDLGERCRKYYLEYFSRAAYFANLSLFLWDNNVTKAGAESHGYFSHSDGSFIGGNEEIVRTMINAATSDDPAYTLDDVYNKAPK